MGSDLKPSEFLRQMSHPDTLTVHPGFVHPVPKWRRYTREHQQESVNNHVFLKTWKTLWCYCVAMFMSGRKEESVLKWEDPVKIESF